MAAVRSDVEVAGENMEEASNKVAMVEVSNKVAMVEGDRKKVVMVEEDRKKVVMVEEDSKAIREVTVEEVSKTITVDVLVEETFLKVETMVEVEAMEAEMTMT